jgi:hypothetical protein
MYICKCKYIYIALYISMCVYVYMYAYIYIKREREHDCDCIHGFVWRDMGMQERKRKWQWIILKHNVSVYEDSIMQYTINYWIIGEQGNREGNRGSKID